MAMETELRSVAQARMLLNASRRSVRDNELAVLLNLIAIVGHCLTAVGPWSLMVFAGMHLSFVYLHTRFAKAARNRIAQLQEWFNELG